MNRSKNIFTRKHITTAVIMLMALLWLTVSTPFVFAAEQVKKELAKKHCEKQPCEDSVPGPTEEKSESGVNTLAEYLHELSFTGPVSFPVVQFFKCHPSDLYFSFHPELLSPPPEA